MLHETKTLSVDYGFQRKKLFFTNIFKVLKYLTVVDMEGAVLNCLNCFDIINVMMMSSLPGGRSILLCHLGLR